MRRGLTFVAVLFCLANRAEAQQCTGGPSFRDAPTQAGLAASFVGERHEIGGTFGFGRPSLFGGIGVSATHLSFVGTAPTFSAVIGTEIASADHPVFTCPLFQASYSTGPDDDPFDVSSFGFRTGVSVGAVVVQQNAMAVIPTFSLMMSNASIVPL